MRRTAAARWRDSHTDAELHAGEGITNLLQHDVKSGMAGYSYMAPWPIV